MKMYKQPMTEITAVDTERMMLDITVSINGGGGGGKTEAPRKGTPIE